MCIFFFQNFTYIHLLSSKLQLGAFFNFDRFLKKCICEGKKSYKDDSSDEENEVATTQSPFGDLGNLTKTSLSSELSGHVSFFT